MGKDRRKDVVTRHALTEDEQDKDGLKRKDYESSLRDLHVKLVELQEWVRHEAKKICILFEGRTAPAKAALSKPSRPG